MSDSLWQRWCDHSAATNLWVNGTNLVQIELADGRVVTGPPRALNDNELFDAIRALRKGRGHE